FCFFFFQAEDGIRDKLVTGVQTCALPISSDRAAWRLQKLKRRTARAKVFNYRAALWDGGAKLPTKTKFDGVLVDAPCSGLGTWRSEERRVGKECRSRGSPSY